MGIGKAFRGNCRVCKAVRKAAVAVRVGWGIGKTFRGSSRVSRAVSRAAVAVRGGVGCW